MAGRGTPGCCPPQFTAIVPCPQAHGCPVPSPSPFTSLVPCPPPGTWILLSCWFPQGTCPYRYRSPHGPPVPAKTVTPPCPQGHSFSCPQKLSSSHVPPAPPRQPSPLSPLSPESHIPPCTQRHSPPSSFLVSCATPVALHPRWVPLGCQVSPWHTAWAPAWPWGHPGCGRPQSGPAGRSRSGHPESPLPASCLSFPSA